MQINRLQERTMSSRVWIICYGLLVTVQSYALTPEQQEKLNIAADARKQYCLHALNETVLREDIRRSQTKPQHLGTSGKDEQTSEHDLTSLRTCLLNVLENEKQADQIFFEALKPLLKSGIKFDDLYQQALFYQQEFFQTLESKPGPDSDVALQDIYHKLWVTSYLMQTIIQKEFSKKNISEEQKIDDLTLSEISTILRTAKALSEDPSEKEKLTAAEIELMRINIRNARVFTDTVNDQAILAKKHYLAVLEDVQVVYAILRLAGKMPTNVKPLETYIQKSEEYFNIMKKYNISEEVQLAIDMIKAKSNTLMFHKNTGSDKLENSNPTSNQGKRKFDQERKSYHEINNQEMKLPVYLSEDDIFSIFKTITDYQAKIFALWADNPRTEGRSERMSGRDFTHPPKRRGLPQLDDLKEKRKPSTLRALTAAIYNSPQFLKNRKLFSENGRGIVYPGISYGNWVLGFNEEDYYVGLTTEVHLDSNPLSAKNKPETYDEIQAGLLQEKDLHNLSKNVRSFLKTGAAVSSGKDYFSALTVGSKFLAEPMRNWRTWVINQMMLDLIDYGCMNWNEFFRYHPMQGGSFVKKKPEGNSKDTKEANVENFEKVIIVNWLRVLWPSMDTLNFGDCMPLQTNSLGGSELAFQEGWQNYYRELISELFIRRAFDEDSWDMSFKPEEYMGPCLGIIRPRLILDDAVFAPVDVEVLTINEQEQLKMHWKDIWKLSRERDILERLYEAIKREKEKNPIFANLDQLNFLQSKSEERTKQIKIEMNIVHSIVAKSKINQEHLSSDVYKDFLKSF